jgi:hypothetical protein
MGLPSTVLNLFCTTHAMEAKMAKYEDDNEVRQANSELFRTMFRPGETTLHSGIYICVNCRDEIASNKGNPLPPQNHHQHRNALVPIVWRLLVLAQRGPDHA